MSQLYNKVLAISSFCSIFKKFVQLKILYMQFLHAIQLELLMRLSS